MKTIPFIFAFLALSYQLLSQPATITWQGKLLDASGNAITQNNVAMTFAMFGAETAGSQLWPASGVVTKTVNVVQGLYSVQLGTGTGDDIAFTAAMFNGETPWLEVKVGTETLPRTEITNVPFALISNNLSASGWENPGEIGKTTPNSGKFTAVETGSLKVNTGASDGKVLTSDANGNASWTTPYTGLNNFTESNFTYDSKTGVKFLATNAATDVDLVLQPKGAGAILAQQPDGTGTGGNNRGLYAVDLQSYRFMPEQVASGNVSVVAGGANNTASGIASFAMGYLTTSSGFASTTFGTGTTAAGENSLAAGYNSEATGECSIAIGSETTARSAYETVFGRYNSNYTPSSTNAWIATDRLFVVGNGTEDATRSNALTILKNANTTIGGSLTLNGNGTNTSLTFPTGRGTSGQVLSTDGSGGTIWSTPYSGLTNFSESNYTYDLKTGVKLLATNAATHSDLVLSPKGLGAILAQQPNGTETGGNKRGYKAVDLQMYRSNPAQVASGDYSFISGGAYNTASGNTSTAIGYQNTASGWYSIAMGTFTTASALHSTAIGFGSIASGDYSTAMGGSTASGVNSTAMGFGNTAPSAFETVLGIFSTNYTPSSTTGWNATDRLLVVGNGTADGSRSNALTINKNANTTIGGSLTVNGNGTNTSISFPTGRGTSGQILSTDGSGGTSWATPPKTYSVGDFAQGGIVFWVDETGQHGLVCAKEDQSTGVRWYAGTYGNTQAKGDGPYAGEANTSIIIAAQVAIGDDGSTYAARICNELQITENGKTYGDWYLPSKEELHLIYQNKATIEATATSNGGSGFANTYYWSSTESNNGLAWGHDFDSGGPGTNQKNVTDKVRAIRAF